MKKIKTKGGCVSCKDADTCDWYAWINLSPPAPHDFHVVGEVYVTNPGVEPILVPKVPQGINPQILLLDLVLCQRTGRWPKVFVWKPVRYDKVLRARLYTEVNVFCDAKGIADIPVDEIH